MDLRDANAPPAETQAHSAKHRGPVDPARMDFSKYHNLDSAHDAREFMSMVAEYMEYLRGDPRDFEGWDSSRELEEMQLAEKFVHMINNTRGWPLARRAAPEFGTPTVDTTELPDPLRYVLDAVEARLPTRQKEVAVDEFSQAQAWEEDLAWRCERRLVQYIGWRAGESTLTSDERIKEVNDSISTMRMFKDACIENSEEKEEQEEEEEEEEEEELC